MSSSTEQAPHVYDQFALIYNRAMAEDFCHRAFPVIEKLLLKRLPPNARILDLCCGTGQIARELGHRDYRVIGLDGSPNMLRLAQANAPKASLVLADARRFAFYPAFHAALSSFNSLAHASSRHELHAIFSNVKTALFPKGLFLFDLTMEAGYTSKWRGSFGDEQSDLSWAVRPSYDPHSHRAQNHVAMCRRINGRWERHDFTIQQQCFSEKEIHDALIDAGFSTILSFDAASDLEMTGEDGRLFFLCS